MGLPYHGYLLAQATGLSIFYWFTPLFIYALIPLLDVVIGEDEANPPDSAMAGLNADRYYR